MTATDDPRKAAIERLKARQDLRTHVVVYSVVNTLLIVIWAVTGAGYFWPIWPMAGWGVGLALNAYVVYVRRPITEQDIEAEMGRGG